jgi:hypothetical protein
MSKQTETSLLISTSELGFYQQLLKGLAGYEVTGSRIRKALQTAHAFRQIDQVKELARTLLCFPIKEYRLIGQYYLAWCDCRQRQYCTESLESIIDQTRTYKTQALLSRAAMEGYQGHIESELYFYIEALKAACTLSERIEAARCVAIVKAQEGFHGSALKDIESLLPLRRYAEPLVYFSLLNSYAVELTEVNRTEEARIISRVVLASPFAPAYPEWQETGMELGVIGCKEPRSFVSLKTDVEWKPAPPKPTEPKKEKKTAKIISFPKLQEAPPPEKPERVTTQELREMTPDEKRELILAALRSDTIMPGEYNRLMFMFGLIKSDAATNILDLEDDAVLDDLMVDWANLVEPEKLAAVLSTLRDCEDDRRRTDLIDRMIRKAFENSRTCGISESEWRLKVECRLPEK